MIIQDCFECRRNERSAFASEALHFQLKQVSSHYGLDALVLSDDRGNLWSSSNADDISAGLALSVAGLGELSDDDGFCQVQGPSQGVMLKKITVEQTTLYIAAQGATNDFRPALNHVADGVERILARA